MSQVKFYQFEDNTVVAVLGAGTVPGAKELIAGSVDAAQEKHVPVATRNGNTVTVNVGSVTHPMEDKHFIEWVAVATEDAVQIHYLKPGSAPETSFTVDGKATVYAHCNLHGLWQTEI